MGGEVAEALAWLNSSATIAGEIARLDGAQRQGDRAGAPDRDGAAATSRVQKEYWGVMSDNATEGTETTARLVRFLGLMEEAEAWRDRPLSAAIAHYTRGMSHSSRGAVSAQALEFVVAWGTMPDSRVVKPLSDAEVADLPPLGYAIDWAAYAVGIVVADKLAAAVTNDIPPTGNITHAA